MSNAPVCHISTGSRLIPQPRPTLLPSIPQAVDLPSALAAIAALKLLVQMMAGQQSVRGPAGVNGVAGLRGTAGIGGGSAIGGGGGGGTPGAQGQKGKDAKSGGRFVEDRSQRVTQKKRIYQDNDKSSPNYVDIQQINRCVWVDSVTGETIVWSR